MGDRGDELVFHALGLVPVSYTHLDVYKRQVDVPGEFAAQARAAHLHKIALVDGVRRVDDGVDGARGFLTGVEVQRLISVDIDPQEPVQMCIRDRRRSSAMCCAGWWRLSRSFPG